MRKKQEKKQEKNAVKPTITITKPKFGLNFDLNANNPMPVKP